jgi:ABC-type nitrate/sulfonate/bicarbonate transport system permease component
MKNKNPHYYNWKLFLAGVFFPLISWQLLSSCNVIPPAFFASPYEVLNTIFTDSMNGSLLIATGQTMFRAISGFIIGSFIGIALGLFLGTYKTWDEFFSPAIEFLRSIPVLCIFPLFLLFFGIGNVSKILVATWSSFFIVLIPTIYSVKHIPDIKITTAKLFGASKMQTFFSVIIPASLPEIMGGLRIAISISLIAIVVTEMFTGTKNGIGKYIYDAGMIYQTSKLYAGIAIGGILGTSINKLLLYLEKKYIHWSNKY